MSHHSDHFPPLLGSAGSSSAPEPGGLHAGDAVLTLINRKDGRQTIPIYTPGVVSSPCPDPKRLMVVVNGKVLRFHKSEIAKDVLLAGGLRIGTVRQHTLETSAATAHTLRMPQ